MNKANVGFYCLSQLYTQRETAKCKPREGIFPWSKAKIERMIYAGEFPAPIKGVGRINIWPKEEIHAYIAKIRGKGNAE